MAHKTEGQCPIATAIFIRKQADKKGSSVRKMIKEYAKESGLPKDTLDKWVWPRKPTAAKNGGGDKALRKSLDGVAGAIKESEVADEVAGKDMKKDAGPDAPDEFRQLFNNILFVSEKLQMWSDGEMEPNSKDDATVTAILAALPFLCLQAAHVGISLAKIHEDFCRREKFFKKNLRLNPRI